MTKENNKVDINKHEMDINTLKKQNVNDLLSIKELYSKLEELGEKREDVANLLPLGMATKVVVRTNLRNLIDMAHQRLCSRAYWEFRILMNDIIEALAYYSDEWETLIRQHRIFKPKCAACGYCEEKHCCGAYPTKKQHDDFVEYGKLFTKKDFKTLLTFLTNEDKQNLVDLLSLEK